MSTQLSPPRRGSWRMLVVIAVVGVVVVVPTAQFAGRVGQDVAGDGGYYVGLAVAVAAVAALAARVLTALYGVAPAAPPGPP